MRRWSRELIACEIRRLHGDGADLSYGSMARGEVALLRAAVRYFGSWHEAVHGAGVSYDEIRRYRVWCRESIVSRICELHASGVDLSWQNVSEKIDPQLAAAAAKPGYFGSWRSAVQAAGVPYGTVRRYRQWSEHRILVRLRELHSDGAPLNAKSIESSEMSLITAARRRFGSWHCALQAAGLPYEQIVLRRRRLVSSERPRAAGDGA